MNSINSCSVENENLSSANTTYSSRQIVIAFDVKCLA